MLLDYAALFMLAAIPILIAITAMTIGSIPGKIARDRNHPWPDAVNVASWVGLATVALWPLALIWAFLPLPRREQQTGSSEASDTAESNQLAEQRIAELEAENARLKSQLEEAST